ncbi:MAG: hypothetical protein H6559_35570 [Lewinellaceae bacterium]|nr:hypothetical protein [Lewinellaceae bacterium]
MDKKARQRHQHNKAVFCSIRSIRSLCSLLRTDQRRLLLLVPGSPPTKYSPCQKKDGGERQIEAPGAEFKKVLGNSAATCKAYTTLRNRALLTASSSGC